MPNHVPCVLTVCGAHDDVAAFVEFAKGPDPVFRESKFEAEMRVERNRRDGKPDDFVPEPTVDAFQLAKFIPVPQRVLDSGYGGRDSLGYDWCSKNWGTKWDAYEGGVAVSDGDGGSVAAYTFVCAWAPPLPVIDAAATRFPGVAMHMQWFDPYDNSINSLDWPQTMRREYDEVTDTYVLVPLTAKEAPHA